MKKSTKGPKREIGLRERLITVALREIKRQGAHGMTLRGVAKLAGCTPMATYRYFDSKEALLAEIAREGFIHLRTEMLEATTRSNLTPLEQIEAAGNRYIRMALERPAHLLMMFGGFIGDPDDFPEMKAAGESTFFTLVEMMNAGQREKLLPKCDPIQQAVAAWSIVHGFSMLIINGNLEFLGINLDNSKEHARFVARSVIDGLRACTNFK